MTAIRTERLRLHPVGLDLLALLGSPDAFAAAIDAHPAEWFPDRDLADLLALHARRLASDPVEPEYGPWLAVDDARRMLVGGAGFHGPPWPDGTIEIGFGIGEAERGRGYATEAAGGLARWARSRPGIARVVARCEPTNTASIRVLERLGFRRTGEAEGLLTWEAAG
jgi:[ribosomal protein S5]-alanine N-acetyltransferase